MIPTLDIYEDLRQVLDARAAEKIARHLSAVCSAVEQATDKSDMVELRAVVRDLAEAQKRTEQRVEELAEAQKRTEQRIMELTAVVSRIGIRLDDVMGWALEVKFDKKAPAYLGRKMRGLRVLSLSDLGDQLDPVLTELEWDDLSLADSILRGQALIAGQRQEVYVVAEVSVTLSSDDLARAVRRAALLRKKGWKVVALVAGVEVSDDFVKRAAQQGVGVLRDGALCNWEEALAAG